MLKSCTEQSAITGSDNSTGAEETTEINQSNSQGTNLVSEKITLTIGNNKEKEVNILLHGFNTAALYFHFSNEPEGIELIQGLAPQVLRFPGGTTANFYHFDDPGYGYNRADAESVKGSNAYQNAINSSKRDLSDCQRTGRKDNYAVDFVRLAKQTGSSVVIVTNHLHSSFEENLRMVKFFKESGVQIAGVELGNEYYLKAYQKEFPDVQSYIKTVKPLALKIRSLYPEIPLAVVAAPNAEMKDIGANRSALLDNWNAQLSKEDFYDAYAVHLYAKDKSCDQKTDRMQVSSCYLDSNEEYINETIPNGIKAYEKIFPEHKMWVTEWNVKEVFDGLGNTLLQAIYFADYSLMLSNQQSIGLATYHNLLTGSAGFNIIGKEKGSGFYSSASYPVAVLISEAFRAGVTGVDVKINSGLSPEHVTVRAFNSGDETLLYIINKNDTPLDVDLGAQGSNCRVRTVFAENLIQTNTTIKKSDQHPKDCSTLNLPAYSVTLITLSQQ